MNQVARRNRQPKSLPLGVRERIHKQIILLASGIIDHVDIEPEILELARFPISEAENELKEFGIDVEQGWKVVVRNRL